MSVFDQRHAFERVLYASDEHAGLKSIIAIHSTALGPALGGCRIQPYPDEAHAVQDVLRLAEAMTWKAAAAGLNLGGGKAVIIADPARDKTEALLRAYGRAVQTLGGRYITSVDVGSTSADMDQVSLETEWVTAVSPFNGGIGDPSPYTAHGVVAAIKACLYHLRREGSLHGIRLAVQGAGKVGSQIARIAVREGADVVVADPNLDSLARLVGLPVTTCHPDEILRTDCDVLVPCALGGALSSSSIPQLACSVVCGAANNQLATDEDAQRLREAGILYAPDFIVNAGGLIAVADEIHGFNEQRVMTQVEAIGRTVLDIVHLAADMGTTTADAAVRYAQQRIRTLTSLSPP